MFFSQLADSASYGHAFAATAVLQVALLAASAACSCPGGSHPAPTSNTAKPAAATTWTTPRLPPCGVHQPRPLSRAVGEELHPLMLTVVVADVVTLTAAG